MNEPHDRPTAGPPAAGRHAPLRRSRDRAAPPVVRAGRPRPDATRSPAVTSTRSRTARAICRRIGTPTASCPGWRSTPACWRWPRTGASRCSSGLKFLAIFASNLDEFYMVRVSGLKRRAEMGLEVASADGTVLARDARAAGRAQPRAVGPARPLLPRRHRAGAGRRGHPDRALGVAERRRAGPAGRLLPQQDLPGADPARGRPGPPVPLHLRPVAEPRRPGARSRRRRRAVRPGQGAQQRPALRRRVRQRRPTRPTCRSKT